MLASFFHREPGQGLVEYALILMLIAIVMIGVLTILGGQVSEVFSSIGESLNGEDCVKANKAGNGWGGCK